MTKDERVRFTFRLPNDLFKKIKLEAHKQGFSVNALILQILWDWVDSQEPKQKINWWRWGLTMLPKEKQALVAGFVEGVQYNEIEKSKAKAV